MNVLRGLFKTLIALFCLWHIAAVGTYSLYHVEEQPVLAWIDSKRDIFRPYILATSQWQRWNLFSPDPLRRVIRLRIEAWQEEHWNTVAVISEETVSSFRRAAELKTMRRMEEESMQPLQERYVHDACVRAGVSSGTTMRLVKEWFVIPKHDTTYTANWWNQWEPEWHTDILLETPCPERL